MELNAEDERTAIVSALCAGLLGSVNESLGAPMAPAWEAAFRGVPRHAFLPGTVWVGDELAECSREAAPAEWLGHAYADTAVVTQVNDGDTVAPGERWASCSASAPSIVFRMLDLLDVRAGHRVLDPRDSSRRTRRSCCCAGSVRTC
ncbi:hypothetical protein [Streptomyces sp. CB02613]|uniref:hypothetical protein n=1 Tax=Streptomyces sp. CB02613 TaxID=2020328 RepID=UPI001F2B135F|nr:hypothetical protein [Streptomyces sp. CB02613]